MALHIFRLTLLFAFFWGLNDGFSKNYFVSPKGNDSSDGSNLNAPLGTIKRGLELANSGDTLFLLPGTYPAHNQIEKKHGKPDLPIVISSYSQNPLEFAIIDANSPANSENGNEGFVISKSSWISLEKLVFRNCWASVILIRNSNYISISSCHFSSGKRIVHPIRHGSHHVLVENCLVQLPKEVWRGWSWESLHHGRLSHYNGALLHPNKSAGGHIMRDNTLLNMYNGFRTRPISILEDGNTEVYRNRFVNVKDNEFEPETWGWNMHYYHNQHVNIHKMYSIDGVKGGNIYIYGNTYTQTKDDWAKEEVSGIFKYSAYEDGALTYPCYAFNNSYYTEAEVLRRGESTNHNLKHYNNAYFFFEGEKRFHLKAWQPGYELDYDCINQDWPPNIYEHKQEANGLKNTDILFVNGAEGDFRLQEESPGIDAGKAMVLPEFNWVQAYAGKAPDIGAFEGERLADGPPFRFIPATGFDMYKEHPRVSKHRVKDNVLILYFSAALDPFTLTPNAIKLYQGGQEIAIDSLYLPRDLFELHIKTQTQLNANLCSIVFGENLKGVNGLAPTAWGSTISVGKSAQEISDLSNIPVERIPEFEVPDFKDAQVKFRITIPQDSAELRLTSKDKFMPEFTDRLVIYSEDGDDLAAYYPAQVEDDQVIYKMDISKLESGKYQARIRLGRRTLIKGIKLD